MANWCETYLTFQDNGTEQGRQALSDFYNKIMIAAVESGCYDPEKEIWKKHLWEQEIEESIFCKIYSLKGKSINAEKRGYIDFIPNCDLSFGVFHITCYDAWTPNKDFWYILVNTLYQGLIEILYQASEPGCDLYLTNDKGLLPRYILNISIASLTDILKFPGMFNQQLSYGPFMYLDNQDGIQIYQDYKCDCSNRNVLRKFNNIEYLQDFEGDETDILTQIEESGLGRFSSLNNAIESLNANGAEILQDEYEFEDIQPSQEFFIDKKSEED